MLEEIENLTYQDKVQAAEGLQDMDQEIEKSRVLGEEQLSIVKKQLHEVLVDMKNHMTFIEG